MKTLALTRGSAFSLKAPFAGLSFDRIRTAFAVMNERRALASADKAMLADLGLTEAEVLRETHRPFWDLPQGR